MHLYPVIRKTQLTESLDLIIALMYADITYQCQKYKCIKFLTSSEAHAFLEMEMTFQTICMDQL